MRQFASSGFRLWNLGREARVLYTAFCVLIFAGILSSVLYYEDLVGPGVGTKGIGRYYAGEGEPPPPPPAAAPSPAAAAAGAAAASPAAAAGPAIDVPADEDAAAERGQGIVVAVTYRKLLEVTHFHLFTLPVVLLIVAHLFLATGVSDRAKLWWIVAASASVAFHLAAPWLVRYASARLAFLYVLSGFALTVTMSVLTLYPVVAMWRRPPKRA